MVSATPRARSWPCTLFSLGILHACQPRTAAALNSSPVLISHALESPFTRLLPAVSRQASVKVITFLCTRAGRGARVASPLRCSRRTSTTSTRTTLVTVRMCPALNCLPRLVLLAPTSLPSFSLFSASSCPPPSPAGVLSAHPHDRRLLPSCRLSGGELPLDYSHGPAAAAAAAVAGCAAARLSRSMRTDGVSSRGRADGGGRARSRASGRRRGRWRGRPRPWRVRWWPQWRQSAAAACSRRGWSTFASLRHARRATLG